MKIILKMTLLFLFVLGFCSCRTKEKATEHFTETSHANISDVVMATGQAEHMLENDSRSESVYAQWSDSIVERFHELIVTDSCGRVLWHETGHSTDRYAGRSHNSSNLASSTHETSSVQKEVIAQEQKDSVYNGGTLQEVTIVKNKPHSWSWYIGLSAFLFVVVAVIYKFKR